MSSQEMNLDEAWAAVEFADVELKDVRLKRRCQELAVALGQQPTASINQACEDWADTKAVYRFFGNTDKVSPGDISEPHQRRTVGRMSQHSLVLTVQDTTFFNYSHHPQTAGLGEIGNKKQQQRGLGLHSTLVVTPAGVPLGALARQFLPGPSANQPIRPESGLNETMPVGAYPDGASPYGLLDMVGNVWERCATKEGKTYPFDVGEDEWGEAYLQEDVRRALRGGSFYDYRSYARCAGRWFDPHGTRGKEIGFRVALTPP